MINSLIYVKKAVGKDGRSLNVLKIRTMKNGADSLEEKICDLQLDSLGKVGRDERITNLGKLLRKYWIDELPQIYNLAKGDLKLVGIRPMGQRTWAAYPSEIKERALNQKPGLLGINYAHPCEGNFTQLIDYMKNYLDDWDKNPSETDLNYLKMILRNIAFGGMRSR